MRPPPPAPPEVVVTDQLHSETRQYRLLTPLFGGGVDAGTPDLRQPISAKGIRGQLRFWWRATRAAQFETLEQMKAHEDWLWGCAATDSKPTDSKETRRAQSRVSIVVRVESQSKPIEAFSGFRAIQGIPGYAAFPLQANRSQNKPVGSIIKEVVFTCQISYRKEAKTTQEVSAALWAWETFGGVGARTRRGFGAIENLSNPVKNWQAELVRGYRDYVLEGDAPQGVAQVSKAYCLINVGWETLIERYQRFRQGPGFARAEQSSENPRQPGRSYWSEADQIRRITRQHLPKHAPIHPVGKFPRGQLGLPIIFHFKDANNRQPNDPNADPKDTTLKPKHHERLASPLVLRPLGANISLALLLKTTGMPSEFVLQNSPVEIELTQEEAKKIRPLSGQNDVLAAVLEHLNKENP
jgi:CRISPR-associated protein Cmr1